jgi:Cu-processing system permease protein
MRKILKYSIYDLTRSKWIYLYLVFYMVTGFALLYLNSDLMSGITNLMNIALILCPLISIIFGTMYYYNSRDFIELLLAQPIKRKSILLGQYLGLSLTLSFGYLAGMAVPFLSYGILVSDRIFDFVTLLITGAALTFIFTGIAFLIAIKNENRIKGFSIAIFVWLFMAVIYDGLFLLSLFMFNDYPLENFSIALTIFNPIDLARILVMLKLDASAMLGFTGAVFNKFFGSTLGIVLTSASLLLWIYIPIYFCIKLGNKKDF